MWHGRSLLLVVDYVCMRISRIVSITLSFTLAIAGVYALCTRAGMGNMVSETGMSVVSNGSMLMAHCDGFADDCAVALFGHMKPFSDLFPGISVELLSLFAILFVLSTLPFFRQILRPARADFFFVYFKRWRQRFSLSITAEKFLDAFRSGILHPKYHV